MIEDGQGSPKRGVVLREVVSLVGEPERAYYWPRFGCGRPEEGDVPLLARESAHSNRGRGHRSRPNIAGYK